MAQQPQPEVNVQDLIHAVIAGLQQRDEAKEQRQAQRRLLDRLLRQTVTCDGKNSGTVREWLRELQLAFNQVGQGDIVEVVRDTARGGLRQDIERFLADRAQQLNVPLAQVPWGDIQQHVRVAFLNVDELGALRAELDKCRQLHGESLIGYGRRFRELAEEAFPVATRNADQHQRMLTALMAGFRDHVLTWKLIDSYFPNTLPEALQGLAEIAEREERYQRLGRVEEPMEVAALKVVRDEILGELVSTLDKCNKAKSEPITNPTLAQPTPKADPAPQPLTTDHVAAIVAAVMSQSQQGSKIKGRKPNFDRKGRPRCFKCQVYGHIARDCGNQDQGN